MLIWRQRNLKRVHKDFLSFRDGFRFDPNNYGINVGIIELPGTVKQRLRDAGLEIGEGPRE